jgi:hypothetical protein
VRGAGPRTRAPAAALVALLPLGAASGPVAAQRDDRSAGGPDLPLTVGRSAADRRATIGTTIGGTSQTLLFDTGSSGISVFVIAVPATVASTTGTSFQQPFGGGVLLSGTTVTVPVAVAGRPTNGPIAVRLVQRATCVSGVPDCAAKGGIEALAKSIGADGVFGAGLWASDAAYSPLAQLASGVPDSIGVTWRGSNGSVTLDPVPDRAPVATLSMPPADPPALPNGTTAWNNLAVPICWRIGRATQTCTATALDTGAAAMSLPVGFPGGPTTDVARLERGTRITAAAPGTAPFLRFTTGRTLGKNLVTVIPGQPFVDSGLQLFAEFVVVFSLTDGTVRLLPYP